MQNYSTLPQETEPEDDHEVLYHDVDRTRKEWNHIEDLDTFFQSMYNYHQGHGFNCMLLKEILRYLRFVVIMVAMIYLFFGIRYSILHNLIPEGGKEITLEDLFLPLSEIWANMGWFSISVIIGCCIRFLYIVIFGVYLFVLRHWPMKQFYERALKITDKQLNDVPWYKVQAKALQVQIEEQMCIHKRELTELDISHRILRRTNYMVALENKKLLPPKLKLPFYGDLYYWTPSFSHDIELLLFGNKLTRHLGLSLFEQPWQLREEYKKANLREENIRNLRYQIRMLIAFNAIISPVKLIWQVIVTALTYISLLKQDPSCLTKRVWTFYAKTHLRHFNELNHGIETRLNRATKNANKYLSSFYNPLTAIIGENCVFYTSALLSTFMLIGMIHGALYLIDDVIGILLILYMCQVTFNNLVPDDTWTFTDQQVILEKMLKQMYYLPEYWHAEAHTERVRCEFETLFQYRFVEVAQHILSPVLNPWYLYRHVLPRSPDLVDFFRNFTVNVTGVGDICSFAEMDIKKHGNPDWIHPELNLGDPPAQGFQSENGKVEMSLVHFAHSNPTWKPNAQNSMFLGTVDPANLAQASRVVDSLSPNIVPAPTTVQFGAVPHLHQEVNQSMMWMDESRRIEPFRGDEALSILEPSIYDNYIGNRHNTRDDLEYTGHSWQIDGPNRQAAVGMAIGAELLHSIHSQRMTISAIRGPAPVESTPLLDVTTRK